MIRNRKKNRPKPVVLLVLEGWGIAPAHAGNAITEARPEYFDYLLNHYPALALAAAGAELGVVCPESECGHLLIGGGRSLTSIHTIINERIASGSFLKKAEVRAAFKKTRGKRLHFIGLVSASENEASLKQLTAMIEAAREFSPAQIFVHCMLDGRDSTARFAKEAIAELELTLKDCGRVAGMCGRLYGLDEYRHASRLDKALKMIVAGTGNRFASANEAFETTYKKKIFDEEFSPAIIKTDDDEDATLKAGDSVMFWNSDPAGIRPLARLIVEAVPEANYFSLSQYDVEAISPLFTVPVQQSSLGSVIADNGYRQLRVSDSEGFAAVTACLNNGREAALVAEERILIPAPVRERYEDASDDEEIAREIVKSIELQNTDFIAATFASLDRLAHEMDLGVAVAGVRALDAALKKIVNSALQAGGVVVITASHGLAEQTIMPNEPVGSPHAGSLVPFVLVGREFAGFSLGRPQPIDGDLSLVPPSGSLADVAPTILELLQLPLPSDMSGRSLLTVKSRHEQNPST